MTYERTKPGQKTARMLAVEARLGRTLEEDFAEYYVQKGWGQTRLAKRWGVKRSTVFESNPRARRRSWVEMLNLPMRHGEEASSTIEVTPPACEACGVTGVSLERAHWVEARDGGSSAPHNIALLCPNCHTKLDQQSDPVVTERIRAALLYKTANRAVETRNITPEEFLHQCEQIMNARRD